MKHLPDDPMFRLVSLFYEVVPSILQETGKVSSICTALVGSRCRIVAVDNKAVFIFISLNAIMRGDGTADMLGYTFAIYCLVSTGQLRRRCPSKSSVAL